MYYTRDATLELCQFLRAAGAGYTAVPSMPVGGIVDVAQWWRDRDLGGVITSEFHPSGVVDGEPES